MGRKFSLDLRLKLNQNKAGQQEEVEAALESPPLDYKSLGPPLSPEVDAELRAACTFVAQDYKPSDQIYEELYGDEAGQANAQSDVAVDDAAVAVAVYQEIAAATPAVGAQKLQKRDRVPRSQPLLSTLEDRTADQADLVASTTSAGDPITFLDMQAREVQQPAIWESSHAVSPPTPTARPSHSRPRSIPLPVYYPTSTFSDYNQKQRAAAGRQGSADTVDFTPRTDHSEYPWSVSTAPTSAAIASVRSSKRASSNALQTTHENSTPTVDAEWMRRELEKHKKLQEARAQQEVQEQLVASVLEETALSARAQSSRRERNAVGRSSVNHGRAARSDSQLGYVSGQGDDYGLKAELQRHSSQVLLRQTHDDFKPSRSSSLRYGTVRYFRPDTLDDTPQPDTSVSQPESRRRSLTRQIKDYIRPQSALFRRPSVDRASIGSRALSIESKQSAVTYHSVNSNSSSWWRSFKPWPGSRRAESPDPSRPETPGFSFRGRAPTRDGFVALVKGKAPVDLNRELPPLPSLDQWKDDDLVSPMSDVSMDPEASVSTGLVDLAPISRKKSNKRSSLRPSRHTTAQSLPVLPASYSDQPCTADLRDYDSYALMASDFDDEHSYGPIFHADQPRPRARRHRSRSINVDYPPDLADRIRSGDFSGSTANGTLGLEIDPAATTSGTRPPASSVSSSRPQPLSPRIGSEPLTPTSPLAKTRSSFFRRKVSIDLNGAAAALQSPKSSFSEQPQTPSLRAETASPHSLPIAEQPQQLQQPPKRKWWKGKSKRESTWMNRVASVGNKAGLVTIEGRGNRVPTAHF